MQQQPADELGDAIPGDDHAEHDGEAHTTYCQALDSPSIRRSWLRMVMKNAAAHVDAGLASPPDRAAPPSTTAATGPSR